MDPVTALGAASSVVGIASFGIQLCKVLYQFTSEVSSAHESLIAVRDGIISTTFALEQVHEFLKEEAEHLRTKSRPVFFTISSVDAVKRTADQCLIIFWRIEATITNKPSAKEELRTRLIAFNQQLYQLKESPAIHVDRDLASMTLWNRLRWPFISFKLREYSSQLQERQTNLLLVFSVVSLGAERRRTHQRQEDLTFVGELYDRIRRMVTQSDLASLESVEDYKRRSGSHVRERPRLESPVNYYKAHARDPNDLFATRRGSPFQEGSWPGIERYLSPKKDRAMSPGAIKAPVGFRFQSTEQWDDRPRSTNTSVGGQATGVLNEKVAESLEPQLPENNSTREDVAVSGGRSENDQHQQHEEEDHVYDGMPYSSRHDGTANTEAYTEARPDVTASASTAFEAEAEAEADLGNPEEATKDNEKQSTEVSTRESDIKRDLTVLGHDTPEENPWIMSVEKNHSDSPPQMILELLKGEAGTNGAILEGSVALPEGLKGLLRGLGKGIEKYTKEHKEFESKPRKSNGRRPISVSELEIPKTSQDILNRSSAPEFIPRTHVALDRPRLSPSDAMDSSTNEQHPDPRNRFVLVSEDVSELKPESDSISMPDIERISATENSADAIKPQQTPTVDNSQSLVLYKRPGKKLQMNEKLGTEEPIPEQFFQFVQGLLKKSPPISADSAEARRQRRIERRRGRQSEREAYSPARIPSSRSRNSSSFDSSIKSNRPGWISRLKDMFHRDDITLSIPIGAYIIRNGQSRQVPHSGKLELSRQQLKNLESQSSQQSWWKEFAFLDTANSMALQALVYGRQDNLATKIRKTIIQLKSIKEDRAKFWKDEKKEAILALLADSLSGDSSSEHSFFVEDQHTRVQHENNGFDGLDMSFDAAPRHYYSPRSPFWPASQPGPAPIDFKSTPRPPFPNRGSVHHQDLSLPVSTDNAAVIARLTTYAMYQVRRVESEKPPTWAKCQIVNEKLSHANILEHIQKLNSESKLVSQKKAELNDLQGNQVTYLVDDANTRETDRRFEWFLEQLDMIEGPFQSPKRRETVAVLVFLKRVPLPTIDPIALFDEIENSKRRPPRRDSVQFVLPGSTTPQNMPQAKPPPVPSNIAPSNPKLRTKSGARKHRTVRINATSSDEFSDSNSNHSTDSFSHRDPKRHSHSKKRYSSRPRTNQSPSPTRHRYVSNPFNPFPEQVPRHDTVGMGEDTFDRRMGGEYYFSRASRPSYADDNLQRTRYTEPRPYVLPTRSRYYGDEYDVPRVLAPYRSSTMMSKNDDTKIVKEAEKHGRDIVQQLLLTWTPSNTNDLERPEDIPGSVADPLMTGSRPTSPAMKSSLNPAAPSRKPTVDDMSDDSDVLQSEHEAIIQGGIQQFPSRGRQRSRQPAKKAKSKKQTLSWVEPSYAEEVIDKTENHAPVYGTGFTQERDANRFERLKQRQGSYYAEDEIPERRYTEDDDFDERIRIRHAADKHNREIGERFQQQPIGRDSHLRQRDTTYDSDFLDRDERFEREQRKRREKELEMWRYVTPHSGRYEFDEYDSELDLRRRPPLRSYR